MHVGVGFADTDLDPLELGGTVTWTAAANMVQVTGYRAYISESEGGDDRSQLAGDLAVGTTEV